MKLVAAVRGMNGSIDWFRTSGAVKIRGVAFVIHGLNLNPDRMSALISVLNASGIDCLRLSLKGHGKSFRLREGLDEAQSRLEDFKEASYALWFKETSSAYSEALEKARETRGPVFLVGFSYGGLIGLDLLASCPEVVFDRALLFAPALSLRNWDYAVRLFSPFPKLVLPTLSPEDYSANYGTPIAGYNALFETLDHMEAHVGPRINIPTLVFIDPADEVVSFKGLKRLVEERRLDQWRFFPVRRSRALLRGNLRHLIIDEASVGGELWQAFQCAMTTHLFSEPR